GCRLMNRCGELGEGSQGGLAHENSRKNHGAAALTHVGSVRERLEVSIRGRSPIPRLLLQPACEHDTVPEDRPLRTLMSQPACEHDTVPEDRRLRKERETRRLSGL